MSTVQPVTEAIPTKDLFDRYMTQRASTRWAAFYLAATSGLILAWSRSPSWSFKIPFELFTSGRDPLTVPSGFAPVFGPLIEMFLTVTDFGGGS